MSATEITLIVAILTLAVAVIVAWFSWKHHKRAKVRLKLSPGSISIQVDQDPFQAPSLEIANVGEVATTLTEAACILGNKERHQLTGLLVEGEI